MNSPISAEQALRNSLEAATLAADNPAELMRLLQQAQRQVDTFTREVVSGHPSIAAQMVEAAARDVSLSLASTLIAKRAAEKGITLSADEVQQLAAYSLSESTAQAAHRPGAARSLPTSEAPLAKAMSAANGPIGDDMQEALSMAGDPATLLKAINELGRRQLEEMFRFHGVHILCEG